MLADGSDYLSRVGTLDIDIHARGEWLASLVGYISVTLKSWRDDPRRPAETSENRLTAQLCSHLNSTCRHSGWDHLQFKREEPDELHAGRAIDLAVTPRGSVIWVEGREYTEYQTLLPIECKRLPTPAARDRDEREYLFSQFSSTGGIDRFKRGLHGAKHPRAAMIGYIQNHDIPHWQSQMDGWITGLEASATVGWSATDKLSMVDHDSAGRLAHLRSGHARSVPLAPIEIDHLWIEI